MSLNPIAILVFVISWSPKDGDWAMEMLQKESLLKSDNDETNNKTTANGVKRLFFWTLFTPNDLICIVGD